MKASKLLLPQPLEHPTPDLGVAAEGVDRLRRKGITVGTKPLLLGVIAVLAEQIHIGDVLISEGHLFPPLQHQHCQS